jgi:hypothetical protein
MKLQHKIAIGFVLICSLWEWLFGGVHPIVWLIGIGSMFVAWPSKIKMED